MTQLCVSKLTTIGSNTGFSHGGRQAIVWTNAGILLIRPLGTKFSEISINIYTFSFKNMHLKMTSGKMAAILSRPQCDTRCLCESKQLSVLSVSSVDHCCAACTTVKPVCNDHLYNKIYYLWFNQLCVLMKTEGTNLLLLTMSAFWSSSRWPLAT